jgi:predicted MFS family arabinose efflux permease
MLNHSNFNLYDIDMKNDALPLRFIIALVLLFLVYVLYAWDRLAIPVELVEIRKAYNLGPLVAGTLSSVFTAGISLCVLPAGVLVSKIGIRKSLVGSVIVFSVATGYTAIGRGAVDLIAARILTGAGEALFSVCLISFLSGLSNKWKAMMIGLSPSIYGLSTIVGGPAVTMISRATGNWKTVFILFAAAGIALSIPLALTTWNADARGDELHKAPLRQRLRESLNARTVRIYAIATLGGICIYGVLTMLINYQREYNHLDMASASATLSFVGLGGIIGGAPLGALADRIGRKRALILACVLNACVGPLIFTLPYSSPITMPLCFLFGASAGVVYVNCIALAEGNVPAASVPLTTGLLLTVYYAAAALSGTLFEWAAQLSGGLAVMFAAPYLLAACIALSLRAYEAPKLHLDSGGLSDEILRNSQTKSTGQAS